ncbi:hypothetical protein [Ferrithrix thermotolerans]|nr:hypothetical protein [Ferrithrix thermotolerans]
MPIARQYDKVGQRGLKPEHQFDTIFGEWEFLQEAQGSGFNSVVYSQPL